MNTKLLIVGLGLLALALVPLGVAPGPVYTYNGPGVVVVKDSPAGTPTPPTILDNGAAVCQGNTGKGGVCIPWTALGGGAILVNDGQVGTNVAFQVCVDGNGNGICGGPFLGGGCEDFIVFSHSNNGAYHNPLTLPPFLQNYWTACGSHGFPGVIVLLCAGVHGSGTTAHTHQVTVGTVTPTTGGDGQTGDFCGAPSAAKAYVVQ